MVHIPAAMSVQRIQFYITQIQKATTAPCKRFWYASSIWFTYSKIMEIEMEVFEGQLHET